MKKKNSTFKKIDNVTMLLSGVGALNWGLVGAFSFNLVEFLLGSMPVVERVVYLGVGLSAAYLFGKWIFKY